MAAEALPANHAKNAATCAIARIVIAELVTMSGHTGTPSAAASVVTNCAVGYSTSATMYSWCVAKMYDSWIACQCNGTCSYSLFGGCDGSHARKADVCV